MFRKTLILCFITYLFSGFSAKKHHYLAIWKVETLIVKQDTLYQTGQKRFTIDFYYKNMSGSDRSAEDLAYKESCMRAAFNNLQAVRLQLNRKKYSLSVISPCWEHISILNAEKQVYKMQSNSLTLLNEKEEGALVLIYNSVTDQFVYSNEAFDYQLIFSRKLV